MGWIMSLFPVLQNVTLFGKKVLADITSWGEIILEKGEPLVQPLVPLGEQERDMRREHHV